MRTTALATLIFPPLLSGCAAAPTPGDPAPEQEPAPRVVRFDEGVQGVRSVVVDLDEPGHVALFLVTPGAGTTLLYPNHADAGHELGTGRQRISLPADPSRPTDHCRRRSERCVSPAPPPPTAEHWILLVRSAEPLDLDAVAADIGGYPHRHSSRQTTQLRSGAVDALSQRIIQRITTGEGWSGAVCRLEADGPYCVDTLALEPPLEPAG